MKVSSIICELNPLHAGHVLLMAEAKAQGLPLVMCMSGDITQRGEAAVFSKEERTRMALCTGADLVLELPVYGVLSSAEGYASWGVGTLSALGLEGELWFGSECGDAARLSNIASLLSDHETVAKTLTYLKDGISYAAAREKALYDRIKDESALLSEPNNILGIEYIKAIKALGSPLVPKTIKRVGAGHGEDDAVYPSAGAIRQKMSAGETPPLPVPPEETPLFSGSFEQFLWPSLLMKTPSSFGKAPGVSEGLGPRLFSTVKSSSSFAEACEKAQTRRYPYSRVRRALTAAALGISAKQTFMEPPYIRVLGFSDEGRKILREASKSASLPIITKPAHITSPGGKNLFNRTAYISALRDMAISGGKNGDISKEWRKKPLYLNKNS